MSKPNCPTISVILSTYNKPDYLKIALNSLLTQDDMPEEIVIADDGSGEPTRQLIEETRKDSPVPIIHVWHEDKGFRKTQILNKAIAQASSEYLVFMDQDIMAHPKFIADHRDFASPGSFVTGSRILLDPYLSRRLLNGEHPKAKILRKRVRNFWGIRMPFLTPLLQNIRKNDGTYIRGCNMAMWKEDLMAVNGFNNAITGWGGEEAELSLRLINHGLKKRFIKFAAICFHLYHKKESREKFGRNKKIMRNAKKTGITRIDDGIVASDSLALSK